MPASRTIWRQVAASEVRDGDTVAVRLTAASTPIEGEVFIQNGGMLAIKVATEDADSTAALYVDPASIHSLVVQRLSTLDHYLRLAPYTRFRIVAPNRDNSIVRVKLDDKNYWRETTGNNNSLKISTGSAWLHEDYDALQVIKEGT
jgi:hypothetical protein